MKIQPVLSIMFLGFHVAYTSFMSLSASAAGQLMFITGFPFQAEMYVFETEGQEMLLVDVNSLIVCKDKCSHKDSYKKKKKKEQNQHF